MIRYCFGSLFAVVASTSFVIAVPITTTISFQNGADSYTGTFDHRIGPGYSQVDGSTVNTNTSTYYVDGGASALNDAGNGQGLIRFDSIIGGGAIPAGAKIITADLQLRTTSESVSANSPTGGAYNVYNLNTAFNSSSTHDDVDFAVGGNGLAGNVSAIVGSFDGMSTVDSIVNARVDRAVQDWVNGGTNYGLGIRSDRTTDGWSFNTTHADVPVANRPKLNVTYTTDPLVDINSYAPSRDSFPNGMSGATVGTIVDGSTVAEGFLDGNNGTDNLDQPYLVRFDNLDLNFASIYKAELVLVTGFSSSAADSPDPWNVHQMLIDWDGSTSYADLNNAANPVAVPNPNQGPDLVTGGVLGAVAAVVPSANDTEVIHIDVTSVVQAWLSGDANYGFYIGSAGTSNGWQIFTSGAPDGSLKPELRIIGVRVPEPSTFVLCGLALLAFCGRIWNRR